MCCPDSPGSGPGGNNGFTDFKDILGFSLAKSSTRAGLYYASAVALTLAYLLCRMVVHSKAGRVLVAIRDAENRVRFLGYNVVSYKLFAFTLSAMLAGLAGALYAPQVGIINPSEFSPANSIEAVIWVAVGGRGTLWGAILLVEQYYDFARSLADDMVVMSRGEVVLAGAAGSLPEDEVHRHLTV